MKKPFVHVIFLTLLMIGSIKVNAHQWEMHQHITREAFKLLKMSFPNSLSDMQNYIGNDEKWSGGSADGSFGAQSFN